MKKKKHFKINKKKNNLKVFNSCLIHLRIAAEGNSQYQEFKIKPLKLPVCINYGNLPSCYSA